ncbi:hypothetical protein F2Q70_00042458 [Brassica cretica]|uniref:Uncharacterized protein n=1 Tax=Brassica cretica TaxID=69181 RepID=A0A8S9KHZ9_BRACR|nr:hypothetical protein F2Q70_00042458 [Brassica cretica]
MVELAPGRLLATWRPSQACSRSPAGDLVELALGRLLETWSSLLPVASWRPGRASSRSPAGDLAELPPGRLLATWPSFLPVACWRPCRACSRSPAGDLVEIAPGQLLATWWGPSRLDGDTVFPLFRIFLLRILSEIISRKFLVAILDVHFEITILVDANEDFSVAFSH